MSVMESRLNEELASIDDSLRKLNDSSDQFIELSPWEFDTFKKVMNKILIL